MEFYNKLFDFIDGLFECASKCVDIKETQRIFEDYAEYLNSNKHFVHEYNIITSRLLPLLKNDNDIYILKENIDYFKEFLISEHKEIYDSKGKKLLDHINLELVRQGSLNALTNKIIKQNNDSLTQMVGNTSRLENDVKECKKAIKESTMQLVSILGVFSAVVLAFSGGINFIDSLLQMQIIHNVSKYRLLFVALFLGFILYNTIVSLMFIIARLCGRDIGVACKSGLTQEKYNCSKCKDCAKYKNSLNILCQAYNKYPFILFVNTVLIYFMYFIFICWMFSKNNNWIISYLFGNYIYSILSNGYAMIIFLALPILVLIILIKYINEIISNNTND